MVQEEEMKREAKAKECRITNNHIKMARNVKRTDTTGTDGHGSDIDALIKTVKSTCRSEACGGRVGGRMRLTLYVNRVGAGIMWRLCDADTPGAFLSIDANWRSSRGTGRSGV